MLSNMKNRAVKAKDYSVNKVTTTRDHMVSQPSKNINWDPNHRRPPPPPIAKPKNSDLYAPPPSRTGSGPSHTASPPTPAAGSPSQPGPPPIVRRETRPDSVSPVPPSTAPPPLVRSATRPDDASPPPPPRHMPTVRSAKAAVVNSPEPDKIDWVNLSPKDKQVFFSWLDEFFARYLGLSELPHSVEGSEETVAEKSARPSLVVAPARRPTSVVAPAPRMAASATAPQVSKWTRPAQPSPALASADEDFIMSYPPLTEHGCSALDVGMYFAPAAHWDTEWYKMTSMSLVPGLGGRRDSRQVASSSQTEPFTAVSNIAAVFADLSMVWLSAQFPLIGESSPNDTHTVRREARYRPRPAAMGRDALVTAHETYGETIAAFAESFVEAGEYCARGECWDLAAKALESFDQYDYVPQPIPSIMRTHGHLIFAGKVTAGGQVGRWRGGDDRVRRGDIIECRTVTIRVTSGWASATQTLGMPDHTAVVVSDTVPSVQVSDGQSVRPADLGTIEVVEQSVSTGIKPKHSKYALGGMEQGEVWIYRPVSMSEYIGCTLQATVPSGLETLRV